MKNSNDNIENRTRDLPVCSAVPQPTAPSRAPKEGVTLKLLSSSLYACLLARILSLKYVVSQMVTVIAASALTRSCESGRACHIPTLSEKNTTVHGGMSVWLCL
jgi:hypothetical protein